jgi:UDP-2,3-diacylglucosamine pyrophosphatase LpxH
VYCYLKMSNKTQLSVQIISDIHPEYTQNQTPNILDFLDPSADILILAGDCGNLHKPSQLENLLISACTHFKYVLYTPGNHEYYRVHTNNGIPMEILQQRLENIVENVNSRLLTPEGENAGTRLWLLQKGCVQINNILFAGCTLWSNPTFTSELPNYIVRITAEKTSTGPRTMTKEEYADMHNSHVEWLQSIKEYYQTDENTNKLVIVTHHPPCRDMFRDSELSDEFASLYYTDLPREIFQNVDVWVSGHIHKTFDFFTEENCRLVSNQLGKPRRPNRDFIRNFVIEI